MKAIRKKKDSVATIYNKERTKGKLISAVGKILVKEGFQNIRVNKVAEVAGVAKKAIYEYFGGLDGLIKAYLDQVDFWKIEEQKLALQKNPLPPISKEFVFELLKKDFTYFSRSTEMQKIVLWSISEKNKLVRALTDEREQLGEHLLQKADEIFKDTAVDYPATMAILVSAIYYTVLHAKYNGSSMCGINVSTSEGRERIFKAMERLISLTYNYADVNL